MLLDKIIHREIYLIDQAQSNPYVKLPSNDSDQPKKYEKDPKREGIDALKDEDAFENNGLVAESVFRGKKRKTGTFSAYYNFYFELCKRLKQRMKENKQNFKFRKIYNRSKSVAPVKTVKIKTKKIVRKKPIRASKSARKVKKMAPTEEMKCESVF